MTGEEFKFLKHELRTPINHIVGYSELLMEEAQDAGESAAAVTAQDILASGRNLARLLERELLSYTNPSDRESLNGLRVAMEPGIQNVLALCASKAFPADDAWYRDVRRIESAAKRLSGLLDDSVVLGPSPSQAHI